MTIATLIFSIALNLYLFQRTVYLFETVERYEDMLGIKEDY